jgi:polar amino acid transport system substrate-binding protein
MVEPGQRIDTDAGKNRLKPGKRLCKQDKALLINDLRAIHVHLNVRNLAWPDAHRDPVDRKRIRIEFLRTFMPRHSFLPTAMLLSALLLLVLILSFRLAAETPPVRELRFITIEVAPWAARDDQNQHFEGAFFDIVQELEQRTSYRIHTSLTPFARVDRELESGHHDCTILVPRPKSLVLPGELVFNHALGAIARKEFTLETYSDLQDLRISVLRGGSLNERFDIDDSIHKEFDTDYIIGLRKMARGRIDAIVGAISTLQYMAEQEGMLEQLGEPLVMEEMSLYFQCSRRSLHLDAMPTINHALQEMKRDGTVDNIRKKHRL